MDQMTTVRLAVFFIFVGAVVTTMIYPAVYYAVRFFTRHINKRNQDTRAKLHSGASPGYKRFRYSKKNLEKAIEQCATDIGARITIVTSDDLRPIADALNIIWNDPKWGGCTFEYNGKTGTFKFSKGGTIKIFTNEVNR